MLDSNTKTYIDRSVLCWLATCDKDWVPNVSPKEIFTWLNDDTLLIAHLASPVSISNIRVNPNVCVSFIDIFVQKGYKVKGTATIIEKNDSEFASKLKPLTDLFTNQFPIAAVIEIKVTKLETIQAPSYFLYPNTTEAGQIANAMAAYKVKPDSVKGISHPSL
jgi:hypothetical protein